MLLKVNFKRYENVCDAFLKQHDWDSSYYRGRCHSLAYDTIKWMGHLGLKGEMRWMQVGGGLLYPAASAQKRGAFAIWNFHCVVYYRGKVHDVWFGPPTTLGAYIPLMFPKNKNVSWRRKPHSDIWDPTTYSRLEGLYE